MPKTPVRGRRYCREHLQEALQKGEETAAETGGAGEGAEVDTEVYKEEADSDDEIVCLTEVLPGPGSENTQTEKGTGADARKGKRLAQPAEKGPQEERDWEVDEDAPVALRTRGRKELASTGGL